MRLRKIKVLIQHIKNRLRRTDRLRQRCDSNTDSNTTGGYAEITSHDKMKIYEDTATVVIGDAGYELYNYVPSIASSYAKAINKAAKLYGSSATIYDIIIPTSVGITMPDNKLAHVNSTPQDKAIKKIFAKLEKPVQTISLYDALMQHRQEYVYYRTDHHWTSKGAYYWICGNLREARYFTTCVIRI